MADPREAIFGGFIGSLMDAVKVTQDRQKQAEAAKEVREKLEALDKNPLGHALCEGARAYVRKSLTMEDVMRVVGEVEELALEGATKKP